MVIGSSIDESVTVPCRVAGDPSVITFEWTFANSGERFDVTSNNLVPNMAIEEHLGAGIDSNGSGGGVGASSNAANNNNNNNNGNNAITTSSRHFNSIEDYNDNNNNGMYLSLCVSVCVEIQLALSHIVIVGYHLSVVS